MLDYMLSPCVAANIASPCHFSQSTSYITPLHIRSELFIRSCWTGAVAARLNMLVQRGSGTSTSRVSAAVRHTLQPVCDCSVPHCRRRGLGAWGGTRAVKALPGHQLAGPLWVDSSAYCCRVCVQARAWSTVKIDLQFDMQAGIYISCVCVW